METQKCLQCKYHKDRFDQDWGKDCYCFFNSDRGRWVAEITKCPKEMWKPSEEQMKALLNAEGKMRETKFIAIASKLAGLYEDLKKLKE